MPNARLCRLARDGARFLSRITQKWRGWKRLGTLEAMTGAVKTLVRAVSLTIVFVPALMSGFGRARGVFSFFAQALAILPGIAGDYLRVAFYHLTLEQCSLASRIAIGTFFAHPEATVEAGVTIGAYCVLGRARIGARSLISSGVQVLSGSRQHHRNAEGRLSDTGNLGDVPIGPDAWIGAGAIVAAEIGAGATVAVGAVVLTPVAAGATVAGNPARPVRIGGDR